MRPFARHYDAVYSDKDYEADIGVLVQLLGRMDRQNSSLLEIGAGTGNHTLLLAPHFRSITALEIDGDFADVARLKTSGCPNVTILKTPVESLQEEAFDGVAAFFNVFNYVPRSQMPSFLAAISARLKPDGRIVTDLWNGKAVLADPPRPETRTKKAGATVVSQAISPFLDTADRSVRLDYEISVSITGKPTEAFSESLQMHLWSLDELAEMLGAAGLSQVQFWDRRLYPAPATDASWHVWMSAKKH